MTTRAELAAAYAVKALVLQGGGALGAYQGGVFEGLSEAGIVPDWIAGISIGAFNAAIIAGNKPDRRVAQLRAFWRHICRQPWWPALDLPPAVLARWPPGWRAGLDSLAAMRAVVEGQNGSFVPRLPFDWFALASAAPGAASFYDTRPLRATLERFADFERINRSELMRVSIGAVNVRTGNLSHFDNARQKLRPEHFMASGALPPGLPAVQIDGEFYWDGGLVSNTPLIDVLDDEPRRNALIFQVDLWRARGQLPAGLIEVAERQKDIQYSSRTRRVTSTLQERQLYRRLLHDLMRIVPASRRGNAAYPARVRTGLRGAHQRDPPDLSQQAFRRAGQGLSVRRHSDE